jgi:glycosyltransferase involved in cell wall biosynthesis
MRTVRRIHPEVLLLIAGKGPLHDALSARIEDLGLQRHVRLLGYVPDADLALAYRAADLSVVPTVALEGFGLITVESLAAGTPVLVTPVGGLPETVQALAPNLILPAATDPSFAPQTARRRVVAVKCSGERRS